MPQPAKVFKEKKVWTCPDCGGEFRTDATETPTKCPLHRELTCSGCKKTLIRRAGKDLTPEEAAKILCSDCIKEHLKKAKYKEIPFRPDTDEPPASPKMATPIPKVPAHGSKPLEDTKEPPKEHKKFPRPEKPAEGTP